MPTLADVKTDSIFGLFKGEPGTLKSTAALSFPTSQRWYSTDRKMNSIILPAKHFGINLTDIEYTDYGANDNDWSNLIQDLTRLRLNCKYKTVVIDSITTLGDVINKQTIRLKTGTTDSQGKEKGNRIAGIAVNTLEDYKGEAAAFMELMSVCKDLQEYSGTNIVLIAHVVGERSTKEVGEHTHQARIIITGGKIISGKIPTYCQEIYHFDVEKNINMDKPPEYICYTVHAGADYARTALPLPAKINFGYNPLYPTYIKPAIDKLNTMQPKQAVQKL